MSDLTNDKGTGGGAAVVANPEADRPATGARRSAPRKVNRRDPEKRREQNRAAQKVYRTCLTDFSKWTTHTGRG